MIAAEKLYVITPVSNPCRYQSRYNLYRKFEEHVQAAGATLITVEVAFGERPFAITKRNNPNHLQMRTQHELWHKENMINLGVAHLTTEIDPDWKYAAWIDADVMFHRADWATEAIQQLQHYDVIQMFSHAIDLGPKGEPIQTHNGFMWSYLNGMPRDKSYSFWHPGYAWAIRRTAFEDVGGLLETSILGAGDHHMATALIGACELSYPGDMHQAYIVPIKAWQSRAEMHIRRNVGYMDGTLLHGWHGKKKDRRYTERWDILRRNKYDPDQDIRRDAQYLWALNDRNTRLRDDIRAYFRQRNEDSVDL